MHDSSECRSIETERPLRILFHIDDFGRGGTETALIAWLSALDRRLFSPTLAVTFPTDDFEYWRAHSIPPDVPVHILASSSWMHALHRAQRERKLRIGEKLLYRVSTHLAIRRIVARRFLRLARDHDVVCDFDFTFRRIAGLGGVPWFGVSHYSFSARWGHKTKSYVSRRLAQLARYTGIGVLTPAMRREADSLFAGYPVKVVDLPNVIDIDEIKRRAAAHTPLPSSPFIVSVARLDERQKDHRTLLKAYAALRTRCRAVGDLVLLGDGPDRAALERFAVELGLERSVRFVGFCSNPFPYIQAAQVLVLSSRYEGFGMVLSEAMALGTPVLSSDCPTGPSDLLDGGKAGLLVAVGDADGMADALQVLLTDHVLREAITRRAAAKVETFSPNNANKRMLALVQGMIGGSVDPIVAPASASAASVESAEHVATTEPG
jgi:glycosyltransferase involved in cell wall biosynthesis